MKRLAVLVALVLPALGLAGWTLFPQADPGLVAPLFHFHIVSFTTFAAAVVSLFVVISVGQTVLPRHLLLALAFVWMGAVFFIHGVTTPGAVIGHFHPAISWSAWLTLFGGGALFLVGGLAPDRPNPRFLRVIIAIMIAAYALYVAIVVLIPGQLSSLEALPIVPTLHDYIFGVTLALWLASGLRHYWNFHRTRSFVDGLMAFETGWFATATTSMFYFPVWNASWWLYHVLLLLGFLIAIYALGTAYEQIRAFRLGRYYVATSLIVTAALALFSAQFYAQVAYQNLQSQLEANAATLARSFASDLAAWLPRITTTDDLRQLTWSDEMEVQVAGQLARLQSINAASLFDADGRLVFQTVAPDLPEAAPEHHNPVSLAPPNFRAALEGNTVSILSAPGTPPATYRPASDTYVIETYLPFQPAPGGAPVGVLATARAAPELGEALVASRRLGLGLAALSLGGLFLALLFVVRRADQLITNRTRELEGAYRDLRQAEGLRDDLTRMIVHDLRNPLTTILANLELLGKTLSNPSFADARPRFLAGARSAGKRIIGLIDDLLNVGKFEAGELQPALAPVYLPTLLAEKEEDYRSQIEREEKMLTLHAPAELPTVMADVELISRVIDNLVSNAIKYTEPAGHIEIRVERQAHALCVRVCDDGQGIPPAYHTRIFDKFVRVPDGSGGPLRKGTGLGLAFCRLAVEAHQGRIWVESVPGHGSTFSFTLPL